MEVVRGREEEKEILVGIKKGKMDPFFPRIISLARKVDRKIMKNSEKFDGKIEKKWEKIKKLRKVEEKSIKNNQ